MKNRLPIILACLAPFASHGTTLAPPARDTGITIKVADSVNEAIDGKQYARFDITISNTTEKVAWIGTKKDAELDKLVLNHNPQSIAYSIWHGASFHAISEVLHRGKAGWDSALTPGSDFIGLPVMTYSKLDARASIEFAVMLDHHQFAQPGTMHFTFYFSWDERGRKWFYQVSRKLESPNMLDIAPDEEMAHLAWAKKTEARPERLKRLQSFWEKYEPLRYPGEWTDEQRRALSECAWDLAGCYIDSGHKHQAHQMLSWLRRHDSKAAEVQRERPAPSK